jgi:predicted alpha/beta hydrolase family esterase
LEETYKYNSDNDQYVPLQKGSELADNLGVELMVVKNGGHLNADSGFTEFPQLLDDIRSLLEGVTDEKS